LDRPTLLILLDIPLEAIMPLHPQVEQVLRQMAEAKLRPIEEMTPTETREQAAQQGKAISEFERDNKSLS
jgi:hypothetical protein